MIYWIVLRIIWRKPVIKDILRPNSNRNNHNIKSILSQDTVLDNTVEMSNVFNQHFSSIGSTISQSFSTTNHEVVSNVTTVSNSSIKCVMYR